MSPMKLSSEQKVVAEQILTGLDRVASDIQTKYASWGMSFEAAKVLVNEIDKIADDLEATFYGAGSLLERQVEVLKSAKVIQHDSDEGYMSTFNSPMKPHQTDSDEGYMKAYSDDQSQAVRSGKSSTGVALAK